jgi:hypothetical protein
MGAENANPAQQTRRSLSMEDDMAAPRLRVYRGPEQPARPAANAVTISLKEVLPMLADAYTSRRTWLSDFADDEISISSDLYEVILAYQHLRRPSA